MKRKTTYTEFYYSVDGMIHPFFEIENIGHEDYIAMYRNKIFCPVCKEVQLSLVYGVYRTYLKGFGNQVHTNEGCHELNYKQNRRTTVTVNKLTDISKITSLLKSTLRSMDLETTNDRKVNSFNERARISEAIQKRKSADAPGYIKRISLKRWGVNVPRNELVVVYGKAFVRLCDVGAVLDENGEEIGRKIYIRFYDPRDKKHIMTSCRKPENIDIKNGYYKVAILGTYYCVESNGHKYHNIKVNYPQYASILVDEYN